MRTILLLPALLLTACVVPPPGAFSRLAGPARDGDVATLQRLVAAGADPNVQDPAANRWTPLMHAIHKNRLAAVRMLLERGAGADVPSSEGVTPLTLATAEGNPEIVQALLDRGADPRVGGGAALRNAVAGCAFDCNNKALSSEELCKRQAAIVEALLREAPDLELPGGFSGAFARSQAMWNGCDDLLALVH